MKKEEAEIRKELEKVGLDLDELVERKKKHIERMKRLDKRMHANEALMGPPKEESES